MRQLKEKLTKYMTEHPVDFGTGDADSIIICMLDRSDFVISYITHSWGGAAKYAADAKRHGKIVIPL